MFTGIVEEVGTIARIRGGAHSSTLEVCARTVWEDMRVGDSICTSGVCLTITSLTQRGFTADVMHETLSRSTLGGLSVGDKVNLERAMAVGERFGGHIVSGHIDGTGTVERITRDGTAIWYEIETTPGILRLIIEKGSIALDGISLTVARVDDATNTFSVSTIPHTTTHTTLTDTQVGDTVNLENDIVGKYIEHLMRTGNSAAAPQGITMDFLLENGF